MAYLDEFQIRPEYPEYELTSYAPVSFTMPKADISDIVVDNRMKTLVETGPSDFQPTERKIVGENDCVRLQMEVRKGEKVIRALTARNRVYGLDRGYMPGDFDEHLKGIKVGETTEFDFVAPDFETEGSPDAVFHCTVTPMQILKEVTAELTDDWVQRHQPPCKTIEDFREQTRMQLQMESEEQLKDERNQRAVAELTKRFDGKIDDYWYESSRKDLLASYEEQAKMQGMSLDEVIENQGMNRQTFDMMLMMQVRDMLVQGFCLDAWARHWKLRPTDKDRLELADIMSGGKGQEALKKLEESDDPEDKRGFDIAVRRYVANMDLVSRANITQE